MKQLRILSLNCRGQTKFTLPKQLSIQDLLSRYNTDILMCQETAIDNETFKLCEFIILGLNNIRKGGQKDCRKKLLLIAP